MHLVKMYTSLIIIAAVGRWCVSVVASDFNDIYDYDYSYTYGDPSWEYKDLLDDEELAIHYPDLYAEETSGPKMPLCCPENEVYNIHNCTEPHTGWNTKPTLTREPTAQFVYKGFPKCKDNKKPVGLYQKNIFFSEGNAFLPTAIHITPIPQHKFCVTTEYDKEDPEQCEIHQTKVYVCIEENGPQPTVYWTAVTFTIIFIILTLFAYFFVTDLRSMQGQYMICLLISLLVYNICILLSGSVININITFVSCISLGAVKYLFYCGVMLWFNVICFDVWRTLKNGQDMRSRRSLFLYSLYSWCVGALLTTLVFIVPYMTELQHDNSLNDQHTHVCILKTDMNMILVLVAGILMFINLFFLCLATSHICSYPKFGNGLPKYNATLSLKQGWKLFAIMIIHNITDVQHHIFDVKVQDLWRYMLLESVCIFAVFAYGKTVMSPILQSCCCCVHKSASQSHIDSNHVQEKDQLTKEC